MTLAPILSGSGQALAMALLWLGQAALFLCFTAAAFARLQMRSCCWPACTAAFPRAVWLGLTALPGGLLPW